jgi:hypothetical protein
MAWPKVLGAMMNVGRNCPAAGFRRTHPRRYAPGKTRGPLAGTAALRAKAAHRG